MLTNTAAVIKQLETLSTSEASAVAQLKPSVKQMWIALVAVVPARFVKKSGKGLPPLVNILTAIIKLNMA
jgi:hypothetical protein